MKIARDATKSSQILNVCPELVRFYCSFTTWRWEPWGMGLAPLRPAGEGILPLSYCSLLLIRQRILPTVLSLYRVTPLSSSRVVCKVQKGTASCLALILQLINQCYIFRAWPRRYVGEDYYVPHIQLCSRMTRNKNRKPNQTKTQSKCMKFKKILNPTAVVGLMFLI